MNKSMNLFLAFLISGNFLTCYSLDNGILRNGKTPRYSIDYGKSTEMEKAVLMQDFGQKTPPKWSVEKTGDFGKLSLNRNLNRLEDSEKKSPTLEKFKELEESQGLGKSLLKREIDRFTFNSFPLRNELEDLRKSLPLKRESGRLNEGGRLKKLVTLDRAAISKSDLGKLRKRGISEDMNAIKRSSLANNSTAQNPKIRFPERKILPLNVVYDLDPELITFPSDRARIQFLEKDLFKPRNVMINRIQFFGDKAYVTMPKLKQGVPFSLGKINLLQSGGVAKQGSALKIEPYPNWAIHRYANVSGIVNAVDIFVDERGVLWILDSGLVHTLESPERVAPPKVFAVDLKKDEVIKAFDLSNFVEKTSRLQHIVVETGDYGCQYVYISDASNRGLIVWDTCNDFGSRLILPKSTRPDHSTGVAGGSAPDIFYLSLVTRNKTNFLLVTFLSSDRLFAVPTYSLQNLKYGTMTGDVSDLGVKPGKMVVLGSDRRTIFFRYVSSGDLYSWDVNTDFKEDNFRKLYSGNGVEFATQMTLGYKKFIWALESNFQDYNKKHDEDFGLTFSVRAVCRSTDLVR